MAFIGCNGVDATGAVSNVNLPEAEIKRRLVAADRRRIVLAAGRKVGVVELARVCGIEQIHELITDSVADPAVLERTSKLGVQVTVVSAVAA